MINNVSNDELDSSETSARTELKRAYLCVSFGQFEQAIEACDRAADAAPRHHLPATLRGSFQMSAGRVRDALATLRSVTRAHPDQPLPKVYFAEACFMAGRRRQGERALEQAEEICQSDSEQRPDSEQTWRDCAELIAYLRQTWQSVEPSQVPPPLVVEMAADEQEP
jgi:predicted Zn-dependent protease